MSFITIFKNVIFQPVAFIFCVDETTNTIEDFIRWIDMDAKERGFHWHPRAMMGDFSGSECAAVEKIFRGRKTYDADNVLIRVGTLILFCTWHICRVSIFKLYKLGTSRFI